MAKLTIVQEVGRWEITGEKKELQAKANEIMASQRRYIEIKPSVWIENNHIVSIYIEGI